MKAHASTARPLSLMYAALVVYASLFPFTGWRNQGDAWWVFLAAPLPRYWTALDVGTNIVGYVPLGFLLALAWLRSGRFKPAWLVIGGSTLLASVLSLSMEALQQFLPARVPSNVDWLANTLGALGGAALAWMLESLGAIARWSRFRTRWFVSEASGALTLLMLWPFALLFPAPVSLGLGQVFERVLVLMTQVFDGVDDLQWLPELELSPLSPFAEMLVVCAGLWVPVMLAYSVVTTWPRRLIALLFVAALAVLTSTLSAALSFGPMHATVWVTPATQAGLMLAVVLGLGCVWAGERTVLALALMAALMGLALINQAPSNAYFVQNLAAWEQGRFVRFHGLAQWLGWLWPFAAMGYAFKRLVRR
jgi:VanZ family protein